MRASLLGPPPSRPRVSCCPALTSPSKMWAACTSAAPPLPPRASRGDAGAAPLGSPPPRCTQVGLSRALTSATPARPVGGPGASPGAPRDGAGISRWLGQPVLSCTSSCSHRRRVANPRSNNRVGILARAAHAVLAPPLLSAAQVHLGLDFGALGSWGAQTPEHERLAGFSQNGIAAVPGSPRASSLRWRRASHLT